MSQTPNYHKAYLRQIAAREKAEALLESRAQELYDSNESLRTALDKLKKQKTSLVQQEKLASIGLLAAGIAHEINNPVGFVKSNLQTLLGYLTALTKPLNSYLKIADELYAQPMSKNLKLQLNSLNIQLEKEDIKFIAIDSVDSIQECLSGIERIEDIIGNLKDYSRTESDKRSLIDINQVVDDALKLIGNELKYKCEIIKDFGQTPLIYGSSGQLSQVFINLAINAAQAMGSPGTLSITTVCDSDYVYILFSDDGPGIAEDNLLKLFDPFFTTKDIDSGNGLGLYVSYGIAKKHHGRIDVINNEGKGATFTVALPIEIRENR
ncbi:MAG: two-component system NtrC family sensor kinase [Glaciecola sp.]|jgi:two-component system NtrC family sensor kinase